eukprot:403872_1
MSQQEIREWAEAGENLDIYQVNAIFEGSGDKKIQCMSYWKTMACVGLQTFGILTLMDLQWRAAGFDCPDVEKCNGNFSRDGWIAFFFSVFVSLSCGEQLRTLGDYGMYKWGSGQPAGVSKFWVAIGLYTNLVVLLLTWVCSTITIMTSKGIDVIVLNSVAVLFMVTLDDQIVTFADYSQIQMSIGQGTVNRCCSALDLVGGLLLKLQLVWKIPYFCGILMFPLTVVVPVLVLGCYNDSQYINAETCLLEEYPPV